LLQWHLDFYSRNDPVKWAKGSKPVLVQTSGGWRLTIAERKRILLDNIYGVDIDTQAVETTKLSLLLKVLEGETQQSLQPVMRMFQERALPDLGENIKCGNSLIGPDFYQQQQMALFDEEERYRINVFDWPVFKNASTYPAIFVLSPKTTSSLSVKRIARAQHLNLSGVEAHRPIASIWQRSQTRLGIWEVSTSPTFLSVTSVRGKLCASSVEHTSAVRQG